MHSKLSNQNVVELKYLPSNITLCYWKFQRAIYRDIPLTSIGSCNVNKAWNITIYLISDLVAKYIAISYIKQKGMKYLPTRYSSNCLPPVLVPSFAKNITTQILVIVKLKWKESSYCKRLCLWYDFFQQTITCSKLANKAQK